MNMRTTDAPAYARLTAEPAARVARAPRRPYKKPMPSPRPGHAAPSPLDLKTVHAPHNIPCPVCGARVGDSCVGLRGGLLRGGGMGLRHTHPERRVLAGRAARRAVYGPERPHVGPPQCIDSLADDPRYKDR